MEQPLEVGGKSEVSGGPQEDWADDRVSVCALLGQILLGPLPVPEMQ